MPRWHLNRADLIRIARRSLKHALTVGSNWREVPGHVRIKSLRLAHWIARQIGWNGNGNGNGKKS